VTDFIRRHPLWAVVIGVFLLLVLEGLGAKAGGTLQEWQVR
jgi:hypothetical protein